jgi:hypothetical protein
MIAHFPYDLGSFAGTINLRYTFRTIRKARMAKARIPTPQRNNSIERQVISLLSRQKYSQLHNNDCNVETTHNNSGMVNFKKI